MKPRATESNRSEEGESVFQAIQATTKRVSPSRNQGVPMPRAIASVNRPKRSLPLPRR